MLVMFQQLNFNKTMEIKDLDLRHYVVAKTGKLKHYQKVRYNKRVVFYCQVNHYSNGEKIKVIVKWWFNQFGGGTLEFFPSELGNKLFDNLEGISFSIPEEQFKLLIE